jgi:hypothetical protein
MKLINYLIALGLFVVIAALIGFVMWSMDWVK